MMTRHHVEGKQGAVTLRSIHSFTVNINLRNRGITMPLNLLTISQLNAL
ncbi:hypothetical protein MT997_19415 [Paenibacillus sp. OVF10]|nr:hypothetical protein MT997_19415 [Paenibacillus sp. OVF10]